MVGGLTQWDKDYLAALYTASDDRVSASQHANGVVRAVLLERLARASRDGAPAAEE